MGMVQMELEEAYVKSAVLVKKVRDGRNNIFEELSGMPATPSEEELLKRKQGEDRLSDYQIQRRRQREFERIRGVYIKNLEDRQNEWKGVMEELISTRSTIEQMENKAEITCDRLMCHTQQRIDHYWRFAVLRVLKRQSGISLVYQGIPMDNIVEGYKQRHREERDEIDGIIQEFKEQNRSAA